ncbi:MAG: hypothetical protein CVT90_00505 [Candidatus Altiarchaeales archaeon HGW-Altiarchaeales-3]|nr:MAG: hypothetical protein CVT90_00505 [Candidatus Altiarchaeales archaeon HGW-Altiarchaeales-3]
MLSVFSGRPDNPMWNLSEEEAGELKSKLINLPDAEPLDRDIFPGGVYIGGKDKRSDFPYVSIKLMGGVVEVREYDGKVNYYKDIHNIEGWIYDMAPDRGYEYIRSHYKFSSNYTTAHKYKPRSDPDISAGANDRSQVTVEQGDELKWRFIIANLGKTKQLAGTITIPKFLTINKSSFSIPPSKSQDDPSIEKFTIEVDTSEPRQIIDEIIIKSNDPDECVTTIPVNFTILGPKPLIDGKKYQPITISETSFKETVKRGTELTKTFKITNHEKTKQFGGVITVPDFLTIDKESFLISPDSSEDFMIKVDTSKSMQIQDKIYIAITYFENGIETNIGQVIKVDFIILPENHITTPEKLSESVLQESNYNHYLIIAIILITLLLTAFIIWYKKFKN